MEPSEDIKNIFAELRIYPDSVVFNSKDTFAVFPMLCYMYYGRFGPVKFDGVSDKVLEES